jgi:hypothetical protein
LERWAVWKSKNRTPFPLEKDVQLRAAAHFILFIPAGILEPGGTSLGELIRHSNESAEIGVVEAPDKPRKIASIIVKMTPGDVISLGRSSEVALAVCQTAKFHLNGLIDVNLNSVSWPANAGHPVDASA